MAKATTDSKSSNRTAARNGGNMLKAKMFKTRHDLEPQVREEMVALLNTQLAAMFDLFSQTKQAHWNVKGQEFYQLHELYDELAGELLGLADMVAERATALGGEALGTVRMAAGASELAEFPRDAYESIRSVEALSDRYAMLARSTREAIDQADEAKDQDTADLFTEVSRFVDKSLWFLEAHIQKP